MGSALAFVITHEQVAEALTAGMTGVSDSKWVILSLVVLALLVMGAFIETVPAMLIAIPMFGPLVVKFGIDPVHFGVVLTYALLLGIVTPPVGLNSIKRDRIGTEDLPVLSGLPGRPAGADVRARLVDLAAFRGVRQDRLRQRADSPIIRPVTRRPA